MKRGQGNTGSGIPSDGLDNHVGFRDLGKLFDHLRTLKFVGDDKDIPIVNNSLEPLHGILKH